MLNGTNLYDVLKQKGYKYHKYPEKLIDRLSIKYRIFNHFHKPKYSVCHSILCKGNIHVHFDDFGEVDIFTGVNECAYSFHKRTDGDIILESVNKLEREIKFNRILK